MRINIYIYFLILLTGFTTAILILGITAGLIYFTGKAVKKHIRYRDEELQLKKDILMELKNNK